MPVLTRFRPLDDVTAHRLSKASLIVDELVNTERLYVRELESIIEFYVKPLESPNNASQIPSGLRGQSKTIFGNIRGLHEFHNRALLPDFMRANKSPSELCQVLINHRDRFFELYSIYCHNKPVSEMLCQENNADSCKFFVYCRKRAEHHMSLSVYLLKPVQRITKYQLLLKELLVACNDGSSKQVCRDIEKALDSMLKLLTCLNEEMSHVHVYGFVKDTCTLGNLRLQTNCHIYKIIPKTGRRVNSTQQRTLLLYDNGILFCKERLNAPSKSQFFNFKSWVPFDENLGFAECSKKSPERFEIWNCNEKEGYSVDVTDLAARLKCVRVFSVITTLNKRKNDSDTPLAPEFLLFNESAKPFITLSTSPTFRSTDWSCRDSGSLSSTSFRSMFRDDSARAANMFTFAFTDNSGPPNHNKSTNVSDMITWFEALGFKD